jgi:hypothetical protein
MAEANAVMVPHLIVNRAEVISDGCSACGKVFASGHVGERALTAVIGQSSVTYLFCAQCGDAIMGRVQADGIRQRYAWDWAIPLKGNPLNQNGNAKK